MSIVWTWWEGYEGGKDEYSMNRMSRIWRRKGWVWYEHDAKDKKEERMSIVWTGWEGYKKERMSIVWTGWEGYERGKDEYSMNRMRRI